MKRFLSALTIVCLSYSLTGCLDSETASLTTNSGQTSATLDANPGILKGQTVKSNNTQTGSVVNALNGINGLTVILSLPATESGTATATFKNTPAMQLADDAAGLKSYAQGAVAGFKEYEPQFVALADNVAGFAALAKQIATAYGYAPSTSDQDDVFTQIETQARIAATSATSLDAFITTVQANGAVPTPAN